MIHDKVIQKCTSLASQQAQIRHAEFVACSPTSGDELDRGDVVEEAAVVAEAAAARSTGSRRLMGIVRQLCMEQATR